MDKTTKDAMRRMDEQHASNRKDGFDAYMNDPLVRMVVSMMPRDEGNPDLVRETLKAFYEAGFTAGAASVARVMTTSIIGSLGKEK